MQRSPYLIQELLYRHAAERPQALFVDDGAECLSYAETARRAAGLAEALVDRGLERGQRVGFFMDKGANAFTAILGILTAQAAYVPLDVKSPASRLGVLAANCGLSHLVVDAGSLKALAPALEQLPRPLEVVVLSCPYKTAAQAVAEDLGGTGAPEGLRLMALETADLDGTPPASWDAVAQDLAYVIYTSGSTGEPKGVMITHGNVLDYAAWTTAFFEVAPEDRLSSHAELHFDLSVFDLYTALMAGASLHPVPPAANMFPVKFCEFVAQRELSVWCSVPSLLTYVAKSGALAQYPMPSLRAVTFCGEVMPTATAMAWMEALPDLRFVNQYGPTETTCASMYHELTEKPRDPHVPVPIGQAMPNTEVFALTEDGRRAGPGEEGELIIRGAGNGLGYWRDPERTAAAFKMHPLDPDTPERVYHTGDMVKRREDGGYDFIGRKDFQIKYMGYRIELGEIESALCAVDQVTAAGAVAVDNEATGGVAIVAFVSLREELAVAELRRSLAEKLPPHMLPRELRVLKTMPFNANGKVDRIALKTLCG